MIKFDLKFCDICGKRTDDLIGFLTLFKNVPTYHGKEISYVSKRTIWSRRLCDSCLKKMTAMTSIGDKIKHDFELMLDKVRISNENYALLPDNLMNTLNEPKTIKK